MQIKLLRGTAKPKDKERARKWDSAPVGIPDPPLYLKGISLREWERVTPVLRDLGVLTDLDLHSLGCYCLAVEQVEVCTEKVRETGRVILMNAKPLPGPENKGKPDPRTGNWVQNPWLVQLERARKEVGYWAEQFGLSASSRSRIDLAGPAPSPHKSTPKDKDPFEEALRRYGL